MVWAKSGFHDKHGTMHEAVAPLVRKHCIIYTSMLDEEVITPSYKGFTSVNRQLEISEQFWAFSWHFQIGNKNMGTVLSMLCCFRPKLV